MGAGRSFDQPSAAGFDSIIQFNIGIASVGVDVTIPSVPEAVRAVRLRAPLLHIASKAVSSCRRRPVIAVTTDV